METALFSGVGASDWSWSALFGDYDQDGEQDLFVLVIGMMSHVVVGM